MIFLITRSLADGIRLFATALVIAVVTGVPVPWVVLVLGAAMIVYTVRGGVSAVIWTDVVQMFVYIAGAAAVALSLLDRIPGGWPTVVEAGRAAGKFTLLRPVVGSRAAPYTLWAGLARRRRADARDARHRSVSRAAAAVGAQRRARPRAAWS